MIQETIARLTGLLDFKVDLSGLQRFNSQLNQVEQRMKAMSKQARHIAKVGRSVNSGTGCSMSPTTRKERRTS